MSAVILILTALLAQQAPSAPPPFPRPTAPPARPGDPPVVQPAPPPVASPPVAGQPTEAMLGLPIYPGGQFIAAYDAGRGQKFYLFGATASFVDVVTFYRTVLKDKGDLVFDAPATHTFEVGRFKEETMAFPSGVTVKDFQSQVSQGYPNPKLGAQPAWFPTVIQIVPVVPDK